MGHRRRGEQVVGARLDRLTGDGLAVLHDRRIPRNRANIDHVVVSRAGVFVVDAKKYKGRPALRVEGGLFRPRAETLVVGGRNCSKLVDGVLKQVDLVRAALDDPALPRHRGALLRRGRVAALRWLLHDPRRARPLAETPRSGRGGRTDDARAEAPRAHRRRIGPRPHRAGLSARLKRHRRATSDRVGTAYAIGSEVAEAPG